MDKLISLVDSAVDGNIDEKLLQQFISKVTVLEYNSISRENYLAPPWDEKEKIIRNYYSEMLKRLQDDKIILFFLFVCLFFWVIMSRYKNRKDRGYLSFIYQKAEEDVMNSCFYCNKCLLCNKFQASRFEF